MGTFLPVVSRLTCPYSTFITESYVVISTTHPSFSPAIVPIAFVFLHGSRKVLSITVEPISTPVMPFWFFLQPQLACGLCHAFHSHKKNVL
jgi:hypothetical protein